MAIYIEINEIDNGFTVSLFDSEGPMELDKTVFVKTFDEVLKEVSEWHKKLDAFIKEES